MKPPLTPTMASPCSIPAFPAGLSGATSMTFRTSRPLTWTCSARIPSRCAIDPAAAGVEAEGALRVPGREQPRRAARVHWAHGSGQRRRPGRTSRGRPFPAALRPGIEVRANVAPLGGYGAVAAGTRSPLIVWRRLEDVDVNLVAGCRCLHSLGIGRRPAIFRPRDFDLDHVINLCLSGAAKDLAHDPIDDDGRPFLGLGGPLGGGGRAKQAHDAQRDRGSEHRSLGVTHVGSLDLDEEKARLTRRRDLAAEASIPEASPAARPGHTIRK